VVKNDDRLRQAATGCRIRTEREFAACRAQDTMTPPLAVLAGTVMSLLDVLCSDIVLTVMCSLPCASAFVGRSLRSNRSLSCAHFGVHIPALYSPRCTDCCAAIAVTCSWLYFIWVPVLTVLCTMCCADCAKCALLNVSCSLCCARSSACVLCRCSLTLSLAHLCDELVRVSCPHLN